MDDNCYLYRIDEYGNATIYAKFPTLSMAKISAELLMIRDYCFILYTNRLYFYEDDNWDYDILTDKGKIDFINNFPNPINYK